MVARIGTQIITAPGWTGQPRLDVGLIDCDGGTVCCLQTQAAPPVPPLSCQPPGICQGPNTYVTCTTDLDCPNQVPGSCTFVAGGADAGYTLSVCPPQ